MLFRQVLTENCGGDQGLTQDYTALCLLLIRNHYITTPSFEMIILCIPRVIKSYHIESNKVCDKTTQEIRTF